MHRDARLRSNYIMEFLKLRECPKTDVGKVLGACVDELKYRNVGISELFADHEFLSTGIVIIVLLNNVLENLEVFVNNVLTFTFICIKHGPVSLSRL